MQAEHGGRVVPHEPRPDERIVAEAALAAAPAPVVYGRVDLADTERGSTIMELELIEPELFLLSDPAAAGRFAAA